MVVISENRRVMYELGEVRLIEGLRCWKLVDGMDMDLKKYEREGDGIRDLEYIASCYDKGERVVRL